ncbi:glycoside hydrolase family 30 protein [Pseudomassariella vexata]|uniref:glucan endo-1,6-beta-glucosidase n=1 Tax=Pseudomassariella vexata TaxID=1141098 RepID=A0A1Y2DYY9_9PEZI|nr:glycoside hydrolase family 30 protein [Pseudomassariella vexata]ORY63855.1 glycoside hydrolase family 30 protein [Pseudomassariella vexata]
MPRLKPHQSSAQAFCSSSDGVYKLSTFDAPVSGTGTPGNAPTWKLTVDDTSSGYKQKVTGFGAAVTDATVSLISALSADVKAKLLRELMTSDGVDFSLLRHTIASSDLSGPPAYSYDDNSGNADTTLAGFDLGDRGNSMADLLADMKALKADLTILGSVWAPPAWMQLDNALTGTTVNNNLDHDYVDAYAQYFVKYIKAYTAKGAPINAITIQNEPLNSQSGYPTMYIYADESGSLIKDNVGPALKAAGLKTEVWAYDHNTDVPSYPQTVIDTASEYVNTVAWHCYASNNNWTVLTDFHTANPSVRQYQTECWTSSTTSWDQASGFTIGPLQNWAQGSLAWTLGSDTSFGPHLDGGCETCRGLVVVDTSAGTYEFQVDYYMMGQYSKFIPRGAMILHGSGSYTYEDGSGIQSVASVNPDGTRTVVIENKFGNDVYVTVKMKSGETWSGRVHASSVVTWILP